jgi:hypothetical protein
MSEEPTTAAIQRYLDALPEDAAAEPMVCELLERAATRPRMLCAALLCRGYPWLTRPPLNLETDEILGGVVASLLTVNADGPLANRAPILRARSARHALAAQSLADVIERESRGNRYFELAGMRGALHRGSESDNAQYLDAPLPELGPFASRRENVLRSRITGALERSTYSDQSPTLATARDSSQPAVADSLARIRAMSQRDPLGQAIWQPTARLEPLRVLTAPRRAVIRHGARVGPKPRVPRRGVYAVCPRLSRKREQDL